MCGIFGCVGKIEKEDAYACIERIKHRGPDAMNIQQVEGATLAHARLSIIDTSELANQPFTDITQRYYIVFNGEIYNFIELRRELENKGYIFTTQSDTEVLLYSYIEWGEEFQNKCNGMWALAIWDDYEKKLFLSRDRFGVKPLYICFSDDNLYFASEMKAFFPIMKEIEPNLSLLNNGNFLGWEISDDCVIKKIGKFPAGHCATYYKQVYTVKKWWNLLDNLIEVPSKYEDQVELFREIFLDSCSIRMRSDVPIGTALSGGIDSSAVIGGMKQMHSKHNSERVSKDWQHAFVASLSGTEIDETKYAKIASDYVGIDCNLVEIDSKVDVLELMRYLYICEVPYLTVPIPFITTYKKIRESGIKVTLDGHGADELFAGYGTGLLAACYDVGFESDKIDALLKQYNEMCLVESRQTISKENFIRCAIGNNNQFYKKIRNDKLDCVNKSLYYETTCSTLPTLLRCYDRYSMANGLEIRMPFMDYRIVSFAFSIPWTSKIRSGYSKAIVRDMARPFMDQRILNRKDKIGFAAPMVDWLKGDWKEFILDTINSKDFYESDLVNSLDICIDYNEFLNKTDNCLYDGERIWQKIVPYLWFKSIKESV